LFLRNACVAHALLCESVLYWMADAGKSDEDHDGINFPRIRCGKLKNARSLLFYVRKCDTHADFSAMEQASKPALLRPVINTIPYSTMMTPGTHHSLASSDQSLVVSNRSATSAPH
jgi:hypothetical protein